MSFSFSSTMELKAISLLLLLLFVNNSLQATTNQQQNLQQEQQQEEDCKDRWIHIRQLPTRFNLDLLENCSSYPLYDTPNLCPYLTNHGLGPKTHSRTFSWHRSDPLLLDLTFHRRLLDYPCLTSDPHSASAVYLPYYATLDSLRFLYGPDVNNSFDHGLDLFDFLQGNDPHLWRRAGGADHFLVLSRPAWDFSQPLDVDPPVWGTSFLELPEFYNLTVLIVEGRAWPFQEVAVPYLTSFHPPTFGLLQSWIRRVRASRRGALMLFAGGGGVGATPNIRRSIRKECENASVARDDGVGDYGSYYSKVCDFVDCSNALCEHDPIRYMRPMLQATFCLQPPGDTPTRRSTFDGIIAGCIPVFFEDQSAKSQYRWHLPEEMYPEFSIFIPKEEVVFNGLRIVDVLSSIPLDQVRRMREKVIELIPKVVYRKHGSEFGFRAHKDAFDIGIDGVLQRIHSRFKGDLD